MLTCCLTSFTCIPAAFLLYQRNCSVIITAGIWKQTAIHPMRWGAWSWVLVHNSLQYAGYNTSSPCLSMSAAILINSHADADGQLQHCLAVPRMAVATSLMELQPDTCSVDTVHDGGVLLGAHHFQAALTLPMADSLTGILCMSGPLHMVLFKMYGCQHALCLTSHS